MTLGRPSREVPSADRMQPSESIPLPERLTLLAQLETSLQTSQTALLAQDVNLLERLTGEQLALLRQLTILLPELNLAPAPLSPAVLAAQRRILHRVRVQQALLDRAQHALRTVANRVTGPQASYAPGQPGTGVRLHSISFEEG